MDQKLKDTEGDKKLPAASNNNEQKNNTQAAAASKERDEALMERYREHYRVAGEETDRNVERMMANGLNPRQETEAEKEEKIEYSAKMMYDMNERFGGHANFKFKTKQNAKKKAPPPSISTMMANMKRFETEMAELEDPTIPDSHPFKVGDDVKQKFANSNTMKISVLEYNEDQCSDTQM